MFGVFSFVDTVRKITFKKLEDIISMNIEKSILSLKERLIK